MIFSRPIRILCATLAGRRKSPWNWLNRFVAIFFAILSMSCFLSLGETLRAAPNLSQQQKQIVEDISAYFNELRSFNGKFSQVNPNGSRSSGSFYILKPGKMRFDYDPPVPVTVVSDGSNVLVYDSDLKTRDLYPLSQTPLHFLVRNQLNLLTDTNVTEVFFDTSRVTVVIEQSTPVGKGKLTMLFDSNTFSLEQWTVIDGQGRETRTVLTELNEEAVPPNNIFLIRYDADGKGTIALP